MKFHYQGRTKDGEIKKGVIEAPSKEIALDWLEKLGIVVTSIEEETPPFFAKPIKIGGRISQRDLVFFTRQLALLLESGIPLVNALWTIAAGTKNLELKEKVIKIAGDVETGTSLSVALLRHPKVFSSFFILIVNSGEMTGKLTQSLKQLADYLEKNYTFRQKFINSLIYPAMILFIFFIVLFFFLFGVLPNFLSLFSESGLEIPWFLKLFLSISSFFSKNLIPIITFGICFLGIFFWFSSQKEGKRMIDRFLLKVPFLGSLLHQVYLTQISQALQILIAGGIHLSVSLDSVASLVGNSVYKDALLEIREKIQAGATFSSLLSLYPHLFPPFFTQMIATGEESGTLELVLTKLVDFQQNEIERRLEGFLRILEPLLILIVAGLVGILVISVITSIYKLISGY